MQKAWMLARGLNRPMRHYSKQLRIIPWTYGTRLIPNACRRRALFRFLERNLLNHRCCNYWAQCLVFIPFSYKIMSKINIIQALCDYFEINLEDFGWSVTEENYKKILSSYDFQAWAYLGYWWLWMSLGEVVKALNPLCEEYNWYD